MPSKQRQRTILHAEDDRLTRAFVAKAIEGLGHRLIQAADGVEALELAAKVRPDLVIVDWFMPRLGGRDLLRALRGDPDAPRVPFLLTTSSETAAEEAGDWGLEARLIKPFTPDELIAEVNKLLG